MGEYQRVILVHINGDKIITYDNKCGYDSSIKNDVIMNLPQPGDRWFYLVETIKYACTELDREYLLGYILKSRITCSKTFLQMDTGEPISKDLPLTPNVIDLINSHKRPLDTYWRIFE